MLYTRGKEKEGKLERECRRMRRLRRRRMKKLKPRCLGCHGTRRMVSRSATASVVGITHHVGHPTATVLRGTDEGAECRTQEPRESTRAVTQPSVPEAYLVSGCSLALGLGNVEWFAWCAEGQ